MIIQDKTDGRHDIACGYIQTDKSTLYITTTYFMSSDSSQLVDDKVPSWWNEFKNNECVVMGPDELSDFSDIYGMVTEPEYHTRFEVDKLMTIREREYNKQIKELVLHHFDSVDDYLKVVKSSQYEDMLSNHADKGYESITYDEFTIDTYAAMQLDMVEKYINK